MKNNTYKSRCSMLCSAALCLMILPVTAVQSAVIGFHFTGNMMVVDPDGGVISNLGEPLSPISANLNYNTDTGVGGSDMSITMSGGFWSSPATFHDITLQHDAASNSINGSILVDWNGNTDMSMHVNWDATGFLNAINTGLEVGDTISGSILQKDTTGDGQFDTFIDVASATPYSDTLLDRLFPGAALEGAAPLAATDASFGLGYDIDGNFIGGTPFYGVKGLINIGSGNSLTVTSVSAVPVPAAVWLFGAGLIALAGFARRKRG